MQVGDAPFAHIGYWLAVLAYGAASIYLLGNRAWLKAGASTPRLLLVSMLASAGWASSSLVAIYYAGLLVYWSQILWDVAQYASWYAYLLALIPHVVQNKKRGYLPLAIVAFAVLTTRVIAALFDQAGPHGASPLGKTEIFSMLSLPVVGLVLVEQVFRGSDQNLKWNVKPACIALAAVFLFDLYLCSEAFLFGYFDEDSIGIRGFVHAISVPLLIVAARRNSGGTSQIRVSRSLAFHSTALLLAGLYILFISGVGYYVRYSGGEWGRGFQLGLLVIGLISLTVFLVSGSVRATLRVFVGKHLFSYRYDYRQEWLRFTATLSTSVEPKDTGKLIIRGLADLLEIPAGALWSRDLGKAGYVRTAEWNMPRPIAECDAESPMCKFLRERGWVIDVADYRRKPERYVGLVLPDWLLEDKQLWLVVPLIAADDLVGFVVLANARTSIDLNWEVIDLLKTAGKQAAGFLAQMQATEALLEARKFDAFNRMSAFVVHDLKNIVTQLSLMMKNATRLYDNPEFRQDMLMTVESSLEKMRQLMFQLREGEAPAGGLSGVDLTAIVTRVQATAASRGRRLDVEVSEPLTTRGHGERVERVIGHIVQNAFDATPAAGRVWIELKRVGGLARLQVGDTGQGMTQEFLQKQLFRPFQTTKESGMGIGAYESYQYIHDLGGKIAAESEPGKGTIVTIHLPLFEIRRESDLSVGMSK